MIFRRNKKESSAESNVIENVRVTLRERKRIHLSKHPNDKNISNPNRGVYWGKKGSSHKDLLEFHKKHIWTYIDSDMNKGWVNISGEEE